MGLFDKIKKFRKATVGALIKPKSAEDSTEDAIEVKRAEATMAVKPRDAGRKAAYRIILRPIISEKSAIAETKGAYTFAINTRATKSDVKTAIELVYGVKPTTVRTINNEGKKVRFGRSLGQRKDWKKAIVTLPKGKTMSIHEGV